MILSIGGQNQKNKNNNYDENPFYCVSCDNFIVAGGSICNIYLWDLRKPQQLYYTIDSMHSGQVTKLRFNPFCQNKDEYLFSASQDGLINQFNLKHIENLETNEEIEDLILTNVYSNDNNGIWNFGFFKENKEYIYSMTNVDSLDIYNVSFFDENSNNDNMENDDNGDLVCSFDRSKLNNMLLIDCFYDYSQTKQLYLLSSSEQLSVLILIQSLHFFLICMIILAQSFGHKTITK